MTKTNIQQLAGRLVAIQKFLTATDDNGPHQFMVEEASELKTNPRTLFINKHFNVSLLKKCATVQLDKHPVGSDGRQSATYNFNAIVRLAEMLSRLEKTTKEMEISEMEGIYFWDEVLEPQVVNADFNFITAANPVFHGSLVEILRSLLNSQKAKAEAEAEKQKSGGKKRDKKRDKKKKKRDDRDEEDEEEETSGEGEPESSPTPAAESAPSEPAAAAESKGVRATIAGINWRMIGVVVVLMLVVLALINSGVLDFITGGTSGAPATTTTYVQPGIQYNPDGTPVTSPTDPLTGQPIQTLPQTEVSLPGKLQGLMTWFDGFKEVVSQEAFGGLVVLTIISGLLLLLDRTFDLEIEDFQKFFIVMIGFTVMVLLPIERWLGATGEVTRWGQVLIMSPQVKVDLFICVFLFAMLALISYLGNQDLSTMAVGLLWAGNILFVAYADEFMAWQPPAISLFCWATGLAFQFIEMLRQENAGQAIALSAVGVVVEAAIFLFLVSQIANSTSVFLVQHVQIASYLGAVGLVSLFMIVLLAGGIKTKMFQNMGRMQNVIETSMFDALILTNCFGGLVFLLLLWA